MRRTTGFAAVLLAAGVLGGSAFGQHLPGGQNLDLAQPDPVIPLPLGHPRMDTVGGTYFAMEFIMFRQSNPIKQQTIAVRGFVDVDGAVTGDLNGTVVDSDATGPFIIRGPLVPGTRYGSGIEALNAGDLRQQETFQPGAIFTLGYKFDSGAAIEARWLKVAKAKYSASASLNPPDFNVGPVLQDTFLFAPVYNFPVEFTGAADEIALGNPNSLAGIWNGAIGMSIAFTQRFDQFDVAGKVPWWQTDDCRVYGRAGARFAWIWEKFDWRTVSADFLGNSRPEDVANYDNIVSNRMYGPFIGMGVDQYLGHGFAVAFEGDVAGLVDIVKERAHYKRGDKEVGQKKAKNDVAFVPEVSANVYLYWYPIEGVQIRTGYNFMSFFNTIAAEDPVAFDFRNLDPDWRNSKTRYIDGFSAGIGFIF